MARLSLEPFALPPRPTRTSGDPRPPVGIEWSSRVARSVIAVWTEGANTRERRQRALLRMDRMLRRLGLEHVSIVAGPSLRSSPPLRGIRIIGPPKAGRSRSAVTADDAWIETTAAEGEDAWIGAARDAFFHPSRPIRPPASPEGYWVRTAAGRIDGVLVDPSFCGRRPAIVIAKFRSATLPKPEFWELLVVALGSLLVFEGFQSRWEDVAGILTEDRTDFSRWPPIEKPQDVIARASEIARRHAVHAARAFEVADVAVFLPYGYHLYCLGAAHARVHAYDLGVRPSAPYRSPSGAETPPVPTVGSGYTAGRAFSSVASGAPIQVTTVANREELSAWYERTLFTARRVREREEARRREVVEYEAPFLGDDFIEDHALRRLAQEGPWVFTAEPFSPPLSASGGNLVVRYQGRTSPEQWLGESNRRATHPIREERMRSVAARIHADIAHVLLDGLNQWRARLRSELLGELQALECTRARICALLARLLAVDVVSLFAVDAGGVRLVAWSIAGDPEPYGFSRDRLYGLEARLLETPLTPQLDELSHGGFLANAAYLELINRRLEQGKDSGRELELPRGNVASFPILRGGAALGLLRVDGAKSLFASHIPEKHPQAALHGYRPPLVPAHVVEASAEVVALLSLSSLLESRGADWIAWVSDVKEGRISRADAIKKLEELYALAPSIQRAAEEKSVHRNTFYNSLQTLRARLGDSAVPWRKRRRQ